MTTKRDRSEPSPEAELGSFLARFDPIDAAVAHAKAPLSPKGKGKLVIQSYVQIFDPFAIFMTDDNFATPFGGVAGVRDARDVHAARRRRRLKAQSPSTSAMS